MTLFFKKAPKRQRDLFAALDIGSSKISCAIAKIDGRSKGDALRIIGAGYQSSLGFRNGVITNLEVLEDTILNAVHSAEQAAKETLTEIYVNIAASCTQSHTIDVELDLNGYPVDDRHIRQLISSGRNNFFKNTATQKGSTQIIHILPLTYAIDQEIGIKDPRGLYGEKLMASLHVITTATGTMQNIANCIAHCHLNVAGFVVSPYSSGLATLVEDEIELGVTLIDIGASNTSIAAFLNGALIHIDSIPVGGSHITSDIARGLSTSLSQAERLKTLYGTIITSSSDERENIAVPQMGDGGKTTTHKVSKAVLVRIIKARTDELLEMIEKSLQNSGIDRIVGQKIVLTGGGSLLPGLRELASQKWQRQIRIGTPMGLNGGGDIATTPMFSACGGLLKYAMKDYIGEEDQHHQRALSSNSTPIGKVIEWIRENF